MESNNGKILKPLIGKKLVRIYHGPTTIEGQWTDEPVLIFEDGTRIKIQSASPGGDLKRTARAVDVTTVEAS